MAANTAVPVPRSIFSVDDCPPGEKFEYWRHSIAAIFDVDAARDVVHDFHATIDSHLLGPLMLARTRTRRQHWVRSSRTIARDGMDHYMVQLFENGGQTVRIDGELNAMQAGQLIVCDLQRTMDNDTTDFQNLSLLVPRALLASQLERPDDLHGLIIDGAATLGGILREHLTSLKETADLLSAEDIQKVTEATVSVVAECLNGIGRATQDKPVAPPISLLPCIKRYIAENLHDQRLTPGSIAYRHRLSAAKLYEMFQPEGGISTYLRVMRLKAAFYSLRDPHQAWRPIDDIARAAGYDSVAFFCRAFESMFDVTVSVVRGAAEMAAPKFASQSGVDRRYEDWLHSLAPSTGKRRAAPGATAGIRG
jgi:AraC-like DNA-binding protein